MLRIENLNVSIGDRKLIKNLNLVVEKGETVILFGPNGAGKSALLNTIMGFGNFKVTSGKIFFKGKDITDAPIDERAKAGLGIMSQRPPNLAGVKLRELVEIEIGHGNKPLNVEELAEDTGMTRFLERDVNVGFSGGEIKRSELLQLSAQCPDFFLLDEPESGVDPVNMAHVGNKIQKLLMGDSTCVGEMKEKGKSALIITHTGAILDYVDADKAFVLCNGTIMCSGNPRLLLNDIKTHGYEGCINCKLQSKM